MNQEATPNPTDLSPVFANEALGAVVRAYTDKPGYEHSTPETATTHPVYVEFARNVAEQLYPHDTAHQQAFIKGSDLLPTMQRQHDAAVALQSLFTNPAPEAIPSEPETSRRARRKSGRGAGVIAIASTMLIFRRAR